MSIFDRFFKKSKQEEASLAKHLGYLNSLRKPTLLLKKTSDKGFSKIGGLPDVADGFVWPEWKKKPLSFLIQLDLSQVPADFKAPDMPRSGTLYFFYNQQQETWGFDPKDKGSWHVTYAEATRPLTQAKQPEGVKFLFKEKYLQFEPGQTYPDWQDDRVNSLNMTDGQEDAYLELCSSVFSGQPGHQVFGHPSPIQDNEMDLQAQLVSNGLNLGDATGYNDPKAKELQKGRKDWILLLQLDSDDEATMMWGDVGMLYFWIKKDDLKNRKFESTWMILQCS
jgi:uncharacterized protein YwqG